MISVGGYQCFLSSIMTVLEQRYPVNDINLLYAHVWNLGYCYNFFELQRDILLMIKQNNTMAEINSKVKEQGVCISEIKASGITGCLEEYIESGTPVILKCDTIPAPFIVLDVDDEYIMALDISGDVNILNKQNLVIKESWLIKVVPDSSRVRLDIILTVGESRYRILKEARKLFGLKTKRILNKEQLERILSKKNTILLRCDTFYLKYLPNYKISKHVPRYVLLKLNESNQLILVDSLEQKEVPYSLEEILPAIQSEGFHVMEVYFEEKGASSLNMEQKHDYIEQNIMEKYIFTKEKEYQVNSKMLETIQSKKDDKDYEHIVDCIYRQIADLYTIRKHFIDLLKETNINNAESAMKEYQEILDLFNIVKVEFVRLSLFYSQKRLGILKDYFEQINQKEIELFSKIIMKRKENVSE